MKHIIFLFILISSLTLSAQNASIVNATGVEDCAPPAPSNLFWIRGDQLGTYHSAIGVGSLACDFGGFDGANSICNYVAGLSAATTEVSSRAGSYVAILQGTGAAGSPNFTNTYNITKPLIDVNGVVKPAGFTLKTVFFDKIHNASEFSDIQSMFLTFDGQVHQCNSCDPITGFNSDPYTDGLASNNCNNWTSTSGTPTVTAVINMERFGGYESMQLGITTPSWGFTATGISCANCGSLGGKDSGLWCFSE